MRRLAAPALLVVAGAAGSAAPLAAQAPASDCSYRRCALGIAPAWNGLAVVRGEDGAHVATLGFFRAGTMAGVFTPGDSADRYAARAVRVRRVAAVLTDAGVLLLGYAAARTLAGDGADPGTRGAAIAGGAALAVSVPLQFSADGLLSRAVWWHNARYAR